MVNEPWVVEGAAVRVSLICFGKIDENTSSWLLDGEHVKLITHELTGARAGPLPQGRIVRLAENLDVGFHGMEKAGAFDIKGELAREWLRLPPNPNGRSNSEVLTIIRNAREISGCPSDRWIIDFFCAKSESNSALFEQPFEYVRNNVLPFRLANNREEKRGRWWLFGENQPRLGKRIAGLQRYLVTPRVSKYRIFVY